MHVSFFIFSSLCGSWQVFILCNFHVLFVFSGEYSLTLFLSCQYSMGEKIRSNRKLMIIPDSFTLIELDSRLLIEKYFITFNLFYSQIFFLLRPKCCLPHNCFHISPHPPLNKQWATSSDCPKHEQSISSYFE